ncbi:hypothetical protein ACFX13_047051 [Malus domestica]
MIHHNQVEKPADQVEEPVEKVEEPAKKVEGADVDHEVLYTLEKAMLSACCGDPYIGGYINSRYAGHQIYKSIPTVHLLDLYKKHYDNDVIKNSNQNGKLEMFVHGWCCFC